MIFGKNWLTKKSYDLILSIASVAFRPVWDGIVNPASPASEEYPPNLLERESSEAEGASKAFDV